MTLRPVDNITFFKRDDQIFTLSRKVFTLINKITQHRKAYVAPLGFSTSFINTHQAKKKKTNKKEKNS